MTNLSPNPQVALVLSRARKGCATMTELAEACEVASAGRMSSELGELREHLRRMVPAPAGRAEARGFVLGVASGLFTHYLLHSLTKRR